MASSGGGDHAVREQSSSRSPVSRCRARATVSPRPTNYYATMPLHLGTLLGPPQQLDGTDLVAADRAAKAVESEEWPWPGNSGQSTFVEHCRAAIEGRRQLAAIAA